MTNLTPTELRRYSRHLLVGEIALRGQERLRDARVLVVGAGGLGSPVLSYLAAAGVGRIGIVDDDVVELTNLQRQTIFATRDIGTSKARVAARFVRELNPHVNVDCYPVLFDVDNAASLVSAYDVVVDCTDRFPTRYLINDACRLANRPDVYASIFRFDGQVSVFASNGPCYRCLFPEPPPADSVPSCAEGGVLGVLPGIVGAWQANEVLKLVLEIGEPLIGRLLLVDALSAATRDVRFERDPQCALCGDAPTIRTLAAMQEWMPRDAEFDEIEPRDLDAALGSATLLDVREPHERALGSFPHALEIPASVLESRLHELDLHASYVVACRLGVRSRWAIARLRDAGLTRVSHLHGGLLAYAATNDAFTMF